MNNSKPGKSPIAINDACELDRGEYEALETALLQTARGRNFLHEYLRRNGGILAEQGMAAKAPGQPVSDTDRILQAVERLHDAVMDQQKQPTVDHVRMDILEMAKAIAKTRSEISAMRTDGEYDHLSVASEEMDAIVQSTEKATNDILQSAEKIQEVAWRLREAGTNEASCEEIDNYATDIYMACSFQDLTGQRTTKVVRVLQYLEARINSMIEIWGIAQAENESDKAADDMPLPALVDERPDSHLLNGPQKEDVALGQDNIDALLGNDAMEGDAAFADREEEGLKEDEGPASAGGAGDEKSGKTAIKAGAADAPLDMSGDTENPDNDAAADETIDEEQLKALFS